MEVLKPLAITLAEAAKLSGIGKRELTKIAHSDKSFPAFKRGSKVLVYVDGLSEYIKRKAQRRDGFAEFADRGC